MARPTHTYGWPARSDDAGNLVRLRQHQGQWSRPKRLRQPPSEVRPMRDATLRHLNACDVNYDGIVGWPGLDLENALDCPRVQCIGRQTIYRFGGKRDHFSRTQEVHRPLPRGLETAGRVG